MRPVSDEFLRTLRGSHQLAVRARVCTSWQTGTNPTGTTIPILAGAVRLDGTADIRSTLDLSTDGTNMWPSNAGSLLAPYGNEIFVERGLTLGSATEWVSLGYHRIDTPEQDLPPHGPIRITGRDRMAGIVDARLTAPVQFASTATYGQVVTQMVTGVYPAATIEWDDTTVRDSAIGRALVCEEDRYECLAELWDSVGKVGYWDHRGHLVITDPPDPADPVWDVNAGTNGVLVEMSRQLTREGVCNAVVATGEAADTEVPVRAVAYDNNPMSPTYWNGAFGKVPKFYSSPFITDTTQAQTAAENMLRRSLGLPYSVDFTAIPNPALEPGDPVRVRYSDTRPAEVHVLESITIPLTAAQPMRATTREQATILIGVS